MKIKAMVEKFQCPGCVCGSNTKCDQYQYDPQELRCIAHVLGTSLGAGGTHIALGLPKGFDRAGFDQKGHGLNKMNIRLFPKGETPNWNNLNMPVWALEQDGFLFVRTFAPRVDCSWVDIVEAGSLDLVPGAINVAKYYGLD